MPRNYRWGILRALNPGGEPNFVQFQATAIFFQADLRCCLVSPSLPSQPSMNDHTTCCIVVVISSSQSQTPAEHIVPFLAPCSSASPERTAVGAPSSGRSPFSPLPSYSGASSNDKSRRSFFVGLVVSIGAGRVRAGVSAADPGTIAGKQRPVDLGAVAPAPVRGRRIARTQLLAGFVPVTRSPSRGGVQHCAAPLMLAAR